MMPKAADTGRNNYLSIIDHGVILIMSNFILVFMTATVTGP